MFGYEIKKKTETSPETVRNILLPGIDRTDFKAGGAVKKKPKP